MRCVENSGYEYQLTFGKIYEIIEEQEGIFEGSPYYVFIDDNGKRSACHQYRFEKIENVSEE